MKLVLLIFSVFVGSSSALASDLKEILEGRYQVINRACLGTPNFFGSPVEIDVNGSNVAFRVEGAEPFHIDMFEGEKKFEDRNGNQYVQGGIVFGNGFAYGETVKNGRFYVSQVEYLFTWENGK